MYTNTLARTFIRIKGSVMQDGKEYSNNLFLSISTEWVKIKEEIEFQSSIIATYSPSFPLLSQAIKMFSLELYSSCYTHVIINLSANICNISFM